MSEKKMTVAALIRVLSDFDGYTPVIVYVDGDYRAPAPKLHEFDIDHPLAPLSATIQAVVL